MSSLLKDVLLRHQQWEDEGKLEVKSQVSESSNAVSARLEDTSTASASSSHRKKEDTKCTAAAPPPWKSRFRTRPPQLRVVDNNDANTQIHSPSPPTVTEAVKTASNPTPVRQSVAGATSSTATLALPFAPYSVQQDMSSNIEAVLVSASPNVVPVAVTEVPTGCGKTMALLSSVLRYQQQLKGMPPKEAAAYQHARRPPWQHRAAPTTTSTTKKSTDAGKEEEDMADGWSVPRSFFKHFRVQSQRKIRAELDVTGSQELRRRFVAPPCTIYYVTRTHAQLRQAVRELRRLDGASTGIRMNILGSRERYCIHPKVLHAKANHTLPVEGNNLGEVCDKLVSMGLCEMVESYEELSCSAIGGPIGHQKGQIWDMEDLVLEGGSRTMCPYYAARDLVFFADINFCTYPYLLDPLIRHETRMERALQNNAIVVFDEAHNVSAVCQDALSLECSQQVLELILSELGPLLANQHTLARQPSNTSVIAGGEGVATMQYPRELHLGQYTLVEIIAFLHSLFRSLCHFLDHVGQHSSGGDEEDTHRGAKRGRDGDRTGDATGDKPTIRGRALEDYLRTAMETFMRHLQETRGTATGNGGATGGERKGGSQFTASASLDLFQRAYGVIMALGVTFNPFLFSIFGLSMLKRWLLLLRFLFQKPQAFVLIVQPANTVGETARIGEGYTGGVTRPHERWTAPAPPSHSSPRTPTTRAGGSIEVRCLDGSLAFNHLLQSVHRVVLASGTLAPFPQLARDLGLSTTQWHTLEGLHVVPSSNYRLHALTVLPVAGTETAVPLRCTYTSLSNPAFLRGVVHCVVHLAETVRASGGGGVLFFVPNYGVLQTLGKLAREVLHAEGGSGTAASSIPLFIEPRKAEALTEMLCQFQSCTQAPRCGTALFFSVYRGKVSEGIDFTDDMARLVICLGVPLQPLKSWKVVAQRAYSGAEWYTTDAVRAVNQALGRCLRHVGDYGAVVLLDERYGQPDFRQRLSKWCRATLQSEVSLSRLCESLGDAFAHWRREMEPVRQTIADSLHSLEGEHPILSGHGRRSSAAQSHTHSVAVSKERLGTEHLPFHRVSRAVVHHHSSGSLSDSQTSGAATNDAGDMANREEPQTSREDLLQSPYACTAVKLLYEMSSATSDVSRKDLEAAVARLAETFAADREDENDGSPS